MTLIGLNLAVWVTSWTGNREHWLVSLTNVCLIIPVLFFLFDCHCGYVNRTKTMLPLKNRYLSQAALLKNRGAAIDAAARQPLLLASWRRFDASQLSQA